MVLPNLMGMDRTDQCPKINCVLAVPRQSIPLPNHHKQLLNSFLHLLEFATTF